jgi:hypothetical protein
MKKFARILESETFGQLVLMADDNDDDKPAIIIYFYPPEAGVSTISFSIPHSVSESPEAIEERQLKLLEQMDLAGTEEVLTQLLRQNLPGLYQTPVVRH